MRVRTLRSLPALALVGLLVIVAACGDGGPVVSAGSGEPGPDGQGSAEPVAGVDLSGREFSDRTGETDVEVLVRDNTFTPAYIEVSVGTTVVFPNRGRVDHNVLPAVNGAFEAIERDDLAPGAVGSITFDEPGDFPYYCSLHGTTTRGMVGAVRVVEG